MNIRISDGSSELARLQNSFRKNRVHYLQEALGLAIFMISACFFSAMLEGKEAVLHLAIQNGTVRLLIMGILMELKHSISMTPTCITSN